MVDETKARILIVEDESIVAADIEQALKTEGYIVSGTASSGQSALSLCERHLPDLVLMDIRLQGEMTGIEAAQAIRSSFGIPIIFLTAYSDEITLQQAKLTEPYGYLLKPFGQKELRASIETALYRAIAEKKLLESERRNRLIVDTAFDAFVAMNEKGVITDWNPQAETTFGWKKEEILGNRLADILIPSKYREAHSKGFEHFLKTGEGPLLGRRIEITALNKSGREFPVELTISPIKLATGYLFSAFIHDISERKDAEESLRKWAVLFQNAQLGIAARSKDGKVFEMVNPEFAQMHGYSAEELIGKPVEGVFAPECRGTLREHVRIVNEKGRHDFESVHIRKDGSLFPVRIDSTSVKDSQGEVLYHLAIVQDLTAKKRLEMAEKRGQELERSNTELERFAHITSHDLQEPLRTISMYTELLAKGLGQQVGAQEKEYMGHVLQGASKMRHLIDDLLSYSRVGADIRTEPEKMEFEHSLDSAIENLQATISKNQAKIIRGTIPTVVGHSNQITLLLQNLIGNAIKFRREEPPVIKIEATRDAEYWVFSVKDNGIGFDQKYAEQIFEMFKRLFGPDQYAGTGMGLALCKKIVSLHGGRIWAESSPAQGTTFYFTLPAADIAANTSLDGMRILVVDDSPDSRTLVRKFLKGTGAQLDVAKDGIEGIEKAKTAQYDLILMDLEMPGLSGVDAASEMRRKKLQIPVVAYTGHQIKRVKQKTPPGTFDDYWSKSLPAEALVSKLHTWHKNHRQVG